MSRATEVDLFRTELAEGDNITVVNTDALPVECWANIGNFAALKQVWSASAANAFTCLEPPRILLLVFQTLEVQFRTSDGAAASRTPP